MAWEIVNWALLLEGIAPGPKTILAHMAQPACKRCGLTWPGIYWLERKTGLGRTTIKKGLATLIQDKIISDHAYQTGGRKMTTEYIIHHPFVELSTSDCGECKAKLKRGRHATGIAGTKQVATRPVSPKGVAKRHQKGSPDDHHSVIDSKPKHNSVTLPADPPATPPGAATPPISDPTPPPTDQDARLRLKAIVDEVGDALGPPSSRTGILAPLSAATDSQQRTAQGPNRGHLTGADLNSYEGMALERDAQRRAVDPGDK